MARTGTDSGSAGTGNSQGTMTFQADGQDRIELPSSDFIADAKMTRDGDNLILQAPNGETVVIEGYFNAEPAPTLQSADGATLTPNLVEAFARTPMEFAENDSASDESPVGAVEEVKGNASVTRADGTVETITVGTPIYQGDVIETDASGAVNIVFMDETSMAVSENARLAIDEYKYDPATESGTTNFSVLRGLFVFTSGLIGRDDPDDVTIDTPVGSIGIRGTVIAGDINPSGESTITVLEGAIVVKNGAMETVLSEQFQTVTLGGFDEPMKDMGVVPANDINIRFQSIGDVNPGLFSMINDAVKEQSVQQPSVQESQPSAAEAVSESASPRVQSQQETSAAETPAQEIAAQPAPEASAIAPATVEIVTLTGDTSALPSIETATGQPTGGLTEQTTAVPVMTAAGTTTTEFTGGIAGTSGASTSPATTTPAATSTEPATDPTQQLAPPSVTNPTNNTPTTPTTPTTPNFVFAALATNDIAGENQVIGTITGSAGVTMSSYTITSGNAAWFTVTMTGNDATIALTQAGENYLGDSFDVRQFGNIDIRGLTSDGQTIDQTVTVTVTDASAGSTVNLSGPSPALAAIITDDLDDMIGYSIAGVGDITGDGRSDFIVTKDTTDNAQNIHFIIGGDTTEISSGTFVSLSPLARNNQTQSVNLHFATTVAGIGDFNGDGTNDYIIGQAGNRVGSLDAGTATIISGATGANFLAPTSGYGLGAGDLFGQSVSGVGDFNNDGYADVIVGAPGRNAAFFVAGRTTSWTGDLLTGSEVLTYGGSATLGSSVTGLGDFNGDGYSDIAVGDSAWNANDGFAMLKFGNGAGTSPLTVGAFDTLTGNTGQGLGQEVSSVGDINGDGLTDLMIGGNGNFAQIYFGNTSGNFGSNISLDIPNTYTLTGAGGVGDFNGDGFDDFVLTFGSSTDTKAYVVYGSNSMNDIDIDYLKDAANAFEFTYSGANNANDIEVSSVGDINDDGYEDFAMGLPDANGAATGNGGLAIVYGRDTGEVATGLSTATQNGQALINQPVMNDAGLNDISMRGNSQNNSFEISSTNFRKIDGGGNTDAIVAQSDLDFSNVNFEQISSIEVLSYDTDGTTITLTAENLFNLLKTSDSGELAIGYRYASTGAVLELSDGNGTDNYTSGSQTTDIINFLNAATGGTTTVAYDGAVNAGFDTFQIGGYSLLIQNGITVDAQ